MSALKFRKKKIHTLIVSDFHFKKKWRFLFWLEGSNPKALLKILQRYDFERLIINGDIFHDLDDVSLDEDETRAVAFLQEYNSSGSAVELIVMQGNHDPVGDDHPLQQNIRTEYNFNHHGKSYIATHGDIFDDSLDNKLGMLAVDWAEWFARLVGIYMFIKNHFNLGIWDKIHVTVAQKALLYAVQKNADYIFIGHTHKAGRFVEGCSTCINSGCLNDWHPTAVIIPCDDYPPEIHKFSWKGEFKEVI